LHKIKIESGLHLTKIFKAGIMRNQKSFTLIELLVVITVIGMLFSIAFVATREAAKKDKR